jgi:hypothetical protein
MGNPHLRGAGEKIAMTEEQIAEYIRCKNDIVYFAENYYYIQTIDDGKIKMKLWDYQKKLMKVYDTPPNNKRHVIICASRQCGKTESTRVFLLHYLLFKNDANIAILANSEKTAKEILARIKMSYQLLPLWLQKGIKDGGWNNLTIELENGVRILSSSTSSNSIVGFTINLLYIDEVSKIADHVFEEFYASVLPTISSGKSSKIIMTSSPKGMNAFYTIYKGAVKNENNFYPVKLPWNVRPDRDEEWLENMKKDMPYQKFCQEFLCKFIGSSNTLVDGDILESIDTKNPIDHKYNSAFAIYEHPIEDAKYILGVDPAKGTNSDYSYIQVFKINSEKDVEQVAVYRNNKIDPEAFAGIIVDISEFYNNADVMVENNDIGTLVCSRIWYDYECERLINCDPKGLGIRATKKTKLEGNLLLKKYVENGWLKINDYETLNQLSRYEEISLNVFHANTQDGSDDAVTSSIWALFYLTTEFYDPDSNTRSEVRSKDNRKTSDEDKPIFFSSNDFSYNPEYNPGYSQQNYQNFSNDFDNFF